MPSRAELSPYIGSRSFRRTREDQRRFFGRDREIEELVGLVVSHSVVLVYAASGAGKTSLFDAGVFPKLVDEKFEVLPRARVRADLPPGVVFGRDSNPYVLSLLCWLSPEVDPAALQHRTIAEHLSTVPRPEGTTGRVMMIDQLEELFTFTPSEWQRHQKAFIVQLREALHTIPDLRVVLITREDFLAQLDDLAPILGGLRVRFHLEPLGREAARQAVEEPLASTGASRKFDQGVADLLVEDLSRVKLAKELGGDPRGVPGPYVEPVQLQIVCDALWNRLPADAKLITAEHLEHYGDVEETLEHLYADSIDACVRATACDKERLARWFDDKLITPSDTRRPVFRAADDTEGLPNRVVAFLEDRRLVHAEDRATGRWYEITHDRLIRPIRVVNARWRVEFDVDRAQQQRHRRGRRIALIGGSIFAGVLVASNMFSTFRARQQAKQEAKLDAKLEAKLELERAAAREHAVTDDKVKAQRERCPHRTAACDARAVEVFDSITEYYWSQGKFDKLVALLKGAADLIPPDYGVPPASPSRTGNDRDRRALLRIRYNPARGVDELRLRREWTLIAAQLSSQWGLSVSPRIQLAADDRVPPSAVDITASPESCSQRGAREDLSTSVQMPVIKQEVLISEQEIRKHPRLSALFDRYRESEEWTKYEALEVGGPWWFVDTWSLPIWRFAGHPAVSREAVLAIVVASELSNRPDFVLDCAALGALLLRAAEVAPVSVREAEAARTRERLRGDLIELVRAHRWSLKSLPEVLDALANHPGVTSPEAARLAVQELRGQLGGDLRPHGPWRAAATVPPTPLAPGGRSRELADALPGIEPPIRVELGPDVMPLMVDAGVLRPEVTQQLSRLRRDLYLRYGVIAPVARFHEAPDLRGLRIEILSQDARSSAARTIDVPPQSAHTRLLEELERRFRADRARWLSSDALASSLEALPAGERTWLERRY
ncbi:MAG TPA: hypothetical protein VFD36_15015, partial [Kofleriaceae bacterium]|nr:hypothetical protein [Kofleriaceae bacterium]